MARFRLIVRRPECPLREAHETLLSAERPGYLGSGAERRWSNSVEEHGHSSALGPHGESAGASLGTCATTGKDWWSSAQNPISRPAA